MKRLIVIGAGIAGLTAAIYAQRSGLDVTLLEQHDIVGGMCTSWRREGYLFEGAVHWLTGSSANVPVNGIWRDTGALSDDVRIFAQEPFHTIEWGDDRLSLYRDIDRTRDHLVATSPGDRGALDRLVRDVKRFATVQMPIVDVPGVRMAGADGGAVAGARLAGADGGAVAGAGGGARPGLSMLGMLPRMMALGRRDVARYLSRIEHPGIRRLLGIVPDGYAATSLVFTLASLHAGDGGYPEGGSLAMTRRMQGTFEALGGTLRLRTKARRVGIENGAVTGVLLDGEFLPADAVIVAQETIAAYRQLFDAPPKDAWLAKLARDTRPVACTFVGIGLRADLPDTPGFELDVPIEYAGRTERYLDLNNYTGFEGYAPPGGVALTAVFLGDTYAYWKAAREEGRYDDEKRALGAAVARAIEDRYPHTIGKIEVVDVATPLTYERYTGAYHGSWMSVMAPGTPMRDWPGALEGVRGVYFAGHRLVPPGGLPCALTSGRRAAQMACRQFDVAFRAR